MGAVARPGRRSPGGGEAAGRARSISLCVALDFAHKMALARSAVVDPLTLEAGEDGAWGGSSASACSPGAVIAPG